MNSVYLHVIRFIGITNSLFLGIHLLRKGNNRGNIYLSLLLFFLGFNLYFLNNIDVELITNFPWIIIVIDWLPFSYAPLIFLYIKSCLTPKPDFSVRYNSRHFFMPVVNTIYLITLYLVLGKNGFTHMVKEILKGNYPWFFFVSMAIKISFTIFYITLIINLLNKNRDILEISSENRSTRKWFVSLFVGFALCTISPLLDLLLDKNLMYESLTIIFFVLWIYLVVYFALENPNIFQNARVVKKIKEKFYSNDRERENIRNQITLQFEEEKLFLEGNLKVSDLAALINQPVNRTSFYINDLFNVNFNELVNNYRLKAFITLSSKKEKKEYSILDLAMECGFNSKTSFNRIFKEKYNQTPSEFIKKNKN